MEKSIKLRPKQKERIEKIQAQKQQLQKVFQDLNDQETTILELILEENSIIPPVANVKLEGENLIITLQEEKPAKKVKPIKEPKNT